MNNQCKQCQAHIGPNDARAHNPETGDSLCLGCFDKKFGDIFATTRVIAALYKRLEEVTKELDEAKALIDALRPMGSEEHALQLNMAMGNEDNERQRANGLQSRINHAVANIDHLFESWSKEDPMMPDVEMYARGFLEGLRAALAPEPELEFDEDVQPET